MRRFLPALLLASAAFAAGVPYLGQPSLCPTRPEIAFVSGGDIWVVPQKGGDAHLLVSHVAEDSRPLYSPDGGKLAFVSTRTGGGDIYILTLASGDLKRLTFDDRLDQLDAWSRDGKWIYFSNNGADVGGKNDIYRMSVEGGTPMPVSADRFTNEFQAAPAPDGASIAFAARGNGDSQWWRHGHSHLDESEIWLRKDSGTYEKLVDLNGRNAWPNWTPDGKQIYFMSDRSGAQNIWTLPLGGKLRQVTRFTDGRVLWPSIGYDGKALVFERDFKIWQLDTKTGEAYPVPITLVGSAASPEIAHLSLNQFTDLAVSADNRKVALIAHGEVFASSAHDAGQAFRVTHTPGPESQIAWAPDSTHLAYVSQRDAVTHVYLYDFLKHAETQLTSGPLPDQAPVFSPDGKMIAFIRDRNELHVVEVESKQDRLLTKACLGGGFGGGSIAWAPDNKWIAYSADAERGLRNVFVIPAAGGAPKQVTFLANGNLGSLEWSPDGKFLIFQTSQRTEQPEVMRLDLVPRQPKYAEEKFDDLFKPEPGRGAGRGTGRGNAESAPATTAAEAKPPVKVEIEFDNIRRRVAPLQLGTGVSNPQISPDGKYLLFSATAAGQSNLYLYSLDDAASTAGGRGAAAGRGGEGIRGVRQLTTSPGAKTHPHFSADSHEVYFLEGNFVQAINVETRNLRMFTVTAEMDVDFQKEKMAVFEQAWAGQRDGYVDPKYNGADWNAVRKTYEPLIEGCRTPDERRALLRLMVGELNSSHSGISAPAGAGGLGEEGE